MDKKKVLFVDDEENFLRVVKLNLEETAGYEVKIVTDAAMAIDAVRKFNPDLIFLDIIMPDIDGGEVAAQLKDDEDLKRIPIVFLTALAKKQEARIRNSHVGGYLLAKPVTTQELIDCIERCTKI